MLLRRKPVGIEENGLLLLQGGRSRRSHGMRTECFAAKISLRQQPQQAWWGAAPSSSSVEWLSAAVIRAQQVGSIAPWFAAARRGPKACDSSKWRRLRTTGWHRRNKREGVDCEGDWKPFVLTRASERCRFRAGPRWNVHMFARSAI